MEHEEALDTGDPYGAIAVWYFDAGRDPQKFLTIFEGVPPKVRGMTWTPEGFVAEGDDGAFSDSFPFRISNEETP